MHDATAGMYATCGKRIKLGCYKLSTPLDLTIKLYEHLSIFNIYSAPRSSWKAVCVPYLRIKMKQEIFVGGFFTLGLRSFPKDKEPQNIQSHLCKNKMEIRNEAEKWI